MNDVDNYENPEWKSSPTKIDWDYYITDIMRDVWNIWTLDYKRLVYLNAKELANRAMADHYKHG